METCSQLRVPGASTSDIRALGWKKTSTRGNKIGLDSCKNAQIKYMLRYSQDYDG